MPSTAVHAVRFRTHLTADVAAQIVCRDTVAVTQFTGSQPGCRSVSVYVGGDPEAPEFFTLSEWDSMEELYQGSGACANGPTPWEDYLDFSTVRQWIGVVSDSDLSSKSADPLALNTVSPRPVTRSRLMVITPDGPPAFAVTTFPKFLSGLMRNPFRAKNPYAATPWVHKAPCFAITSPHETTAKVRVVAVRVLLEGGCERVVRSTSDMDIGVGDTVVVGMADGRVRHGPCLGVTRWDDRRFRKAVDRVSGLEFQVGQALRKVTRTDVLFLERAVAPMNAEMRHMAESVVAEVLSTLYGTETAAVRIEVASAECTLDLQSVMVNLVVEMSDEGMEGVGRRHGRTVAAEMRRRTQLEVLVKCNGMDVHDDQN